MNKILAFAILVGIKGPGFAQIRRETNPSQYKVANSSQKNSGRELMRHLDLTKEQIEKLKDLKLNLRQEREAIHNDDNLTPDVKKQKLQELRLEQKDKLMAILTQDQMAKLIEERRNIKVRQQPEN